MNDNNIFLNCTYITRNPWIAEDCPSVQPVRHHSFRNRNNHSAQVFEDCFRIDCWFLCSCQHGQRPQRCPRRMLFPLLPSAHWTSDPAMKQFLLYLDEKMALGKKFILKDLDDTHVFILAEVVQILQERVGELMDQNSYTFTQK
ncbi:general transcription factor IIH subunit 5 isoform X1 [Pseudoliparis swirei]|uniref:general transcription factor IIH subunit 5 isoform X1 n=1 Tax=Pseudoliparis swirei TaxID=2059687 RepID=UPI0024BE47DA|nr:general transcription factor IIH subunit 5 isoform X1 [Pseudoliparis swirei]